MLVATGQLRLPEFASAKPNPEPATKTPADKSADDDAAYMAFDQGQYLTALSLAEAKAALGDPQAHTLVGRIYEGGLGVGKDEITAALGQQRQLDPKAGEDE